MWVWMAVGSAVMLGIYDIAKKQSLKRNGTLVVLLWATAFSALFLLPFLSHGTPREHLLIVFKAFLVSASWISGMEALRLLPITTASTIKASRPVFVLLFSIILFGERLNVWQWAGSIAALVALYMLSRSSKKEGIDFAHNKGIAWMAVSVLTGVASALYDKHILGFLEPLFVQGWANVYITALLAVTVMLMSLYRKEKFQPFTWDWNILLIAVFITIADFLYFWALSRDGAMLSVVSMIRRSSVIVTFLGGVVLFREGNIRSKALCLAILLAGMAMIVFGTC